jgi:hypothetical protein
MTQQEHEQEQDAAQETWEVWWCYDGWYPVFDRWAAWAVGRATGHLAAAPERALGEGPRAAP